MNRARANRPNRRNFKRSSTQMKVVPTGSKVIHSVVFRRKGALILVVGSSYAQDESQSLAASHRRIMVCSECCRGLANWAVGILYEIQPTYSISLRLPAGLQSPWSPEVAGDRWESSQIRQDDSLWQTNCYRSSGSGDSTLDYQRVSLERGAK
jgi:hypothetical protein